MPKTHKPNPQVFVGSSSSQRHLAYAIQQNLDDAADVTCWDQDVFVLTRATLESLLAQLNQSDFGVFVFAPDDVITMKGKKSPAVRDNIIFELGLFMGRLGASRTLIVAPKGCKLRIPTDLAGVTIGQFNAERSDKNVRAALGPFCQAVREQVKKHGTVKVGRHRRGHRRTRRPSPSVEILEATYGAGDRYIDVTSKVRSLVDHGRLHMYVGNQLGGDPAKHVQKDLVVRFRYGKRAQSISAREREYLILPPKSNG